MDLLSPGSLSLVGLVNDSVSLSPVIIYGKYWHLHMPIQELALHTLKHTRPQLFDTMLSSDGSNRLVLPPKKCDPPPISLQELPSKTGP